MSTSDICHFWVEDLRAGEQFSVFLRVGHPDHATFQMAEAVSASVLEQGCYGAEAGAYCWGREACLDGNIPLLC